MAKNKPALVWMKSVLRVRVEREILAIRRVLQRFLPSHGNRPRHRGIFESARRKLVAVAAPLERVLEVALRRMEWATHWQMLLPESVGKRRGQTFFARLVRRVLVLFANCVVGEWKREQTAAKLGRLGFAPTQGAANQIHPARRRIEGAGCRIQRVGCRIQRVGCRIQRVGCRIQRVGCQIQGVGCPFEVAGCSFEGAGCPFEGAGCLFEGAGCLFEGAECQIQMPLVKV